jgi:hypothetical protein
MIVRHGCRHGPRKGHTGGGKEIETSSQNDSLSDLVTLSVPVHGVAGAWKKCHHCSGILALN